MNITLDSRSLLISIFFVNLYLGFVLLLFRATQKTYPGYPYWLAGTLCASLTYGLLATQGIFADFLAFSLSNSLGILTSAFRLEGVRRFNGAKRLSLLNFLLPLLSLPLFAYFTFLQPSTVMRNLIFSAATAALALQIVWALHKNHAQTGNHISRFLVVLMLIFSLLFVARALAWTFFPSSGGAVQNRSVNTLSYVMLMFFDVSWTIGFILLHNQRLKTEIISLNNKLSQLSQAIEQSPSSVLITDLDGRIEYVNPHFTNLTGYSLPEATGMSTSALQSGKTPSSVYDEMWQTIRAGFPWRGELLNRRKDGSLYWESTLIAPVKDENRQIVNYLAFKEDITERKTAEDALRQSEAQMRLLNQELQNQLQKITRLEAELREQAIRDPLTGLYNRRYLLETVQREFKLAKRRRKTISILLLDIDHFKSINDTYGHNAGDSVLQATALLLQQFARETDLACRYGGEEFLLLLPDIPPAPAAQRAETLRQTLQETPIPYKDLRLHITVSIGLATYPANGKDYPEILQKADQALYAAKQHGRNRVTLAPPEKTTH